MGAWGTGIYSNDTAGDVRDACKDIFGYYDVEEGNQKLFQQFEIETEPELIDDDYASFWYALSDWQWKHGMLNEYVKEKALSLLEVYAGIDDWIESGDKRDVLKRRQVLDKLKNQLQTQQPPLKKPKLTLAKPRHKIGDIIVFRAKCSGETYWKKTAFTVPYFFKSPKISNSKYEDICGYDARGKYMAILCVGETQEVHSAYLPNLYDNYSVYVWYDYLSYDEPSVSDLEHCGFLPMVTFVKDGLNRSIIIKAEWGYKLMLYCEKFRKDKNISEFKKYTALTEVERFNFLFSQKNYSDHIFSDFDLAHMFSTAFEEKNRMELLGESIDNLLDTKVHNPEFLPYPEIDKAYKDLLKEYEKEFYDRYYNGEADSV